MLIVLPDVVDGVLVNAAWAVAGMVAKTRYSRRTSAALELAGWADTEALIRDGLPGARLELPAMSDAEAAELAAAIGRQEVQGALQALLAARLTDAPESDAARAREAVRLAIAGAGVVGAGDAGIRADRRLRDAVAAARWEEQVAAANSGPEAYTGRQRQQMHVEAANELYARRLSEYFDDKVSALVAELEGRVGLAGLAQLRAEAYSGRIVALLGAIERQVSALAEPGRGGQAEAEWLGRYRRQARARHGYLYPPDFDRRRKVRAETIYVNTPIVEYFGAAPTLGGQGMGEPRAVIESFSAELPLAGSAIVDPLAGDAVPDRPERQGEAGLAVLDLAPRLDRTVLLGDPGGGKTTAANVLANFFASDPDRAIPFLVTLREYAATMPPQWSVTEYIEQTLSTLYQCAPPDGLVERLLLTGRAVVIFDGLDELLDASRRRQVAERVEQFCSAFPLTPVLVTSRVVGYNQARLDDTQFSCYRLSGFGDAEVAEYVGKWFSTQDSIPRAEAGAKAAAFLSESANAKDLRANPLLLSLMCILYRGAGSLPGDRAGIYARCAELMLRKWDEQRELYRKLGTDHLVEPSLRYLAWWLFTREDSRTAATERELISKTTEFLHGRGYETEDEARAAAREFVEFCRGRMWVFSDAGTTGDGEDLYAFTHRTFMEYFAAWHLAATSDTPEHLARALAPRIPSEGWGVVAELAIKIKSDMSDRGADRVYAALLDPTLAPADRAPQLEFLAKCLASARPAPSTVRALTHDALDYAFGRGEPIRFGLLPLWSLVVYGVSYRQTIAEELSKRLADIVESDDAPIRADGLRLAASLPHLTDPLLFEIGGTKDYRKIIASLENRSFWQNWSREQSLLHAAEFISGATRDKELRVLALHENMLSPQDALAMPGGLSVLATTKSIIVEKHDNQYRTFWPAYMFSLASHLINPSAPLSPDNEASFIAIGDYALGQQSPPWIRMPAPDETHSLYVHDPREIRIPVLDELGNLGVAIVMCAAVESAWGPQRWFGRLLPSAAENDRVNPLLWYLDHRAAGGAGELPELPVPVTFRQVLRDWAEKRVSFVEFLAE